MVFSERPLNEWPLELQEWPHRWVTGVQKTLLTIGLITPCTTGFGAHLVLLSVDLEATGSCRHKKKTKSKVVGGFNLIQNILPSSKLTWQ